MVWTAAALIHPLALWAQAAAPAPREYVGPALVEAQPVARQPVSGGAGTSGAPSPPPNTDLSMDDVFGPPAGDARPAPAPEGPAPGPRVEVGGASPGQPGELSMDDVFGTDPQAAPTPTPPAASASQPRASATPTTTPMKGLIDAENPGADRGGPAPTVGYGGKLKTRFRLLSSVYYDVDKTPTVRGVDGVYRSAPRRLSRNENRLELYVAYTPNKHVQIVADAEPVLMGMSMARELDDLANQQLTQRFHMESDAAYIALTDLAPGLDIKLGRQIVVWGTADKFNPTNNINADDLEDRPLFTEPIANQMAVIDYAPLGDKLYLQGVYVPLFTPALLPPSATLGLRDPFAEAPYASRTERDKITYLQEDWLPRNSKFVPDVYGHILQPENAFRNGQFAFKLGSKLGEVDLSASYYYGRHDIPIPQVNVTTMQAALNGPPPADGYYFRADVDLVYPKMQVIGLDFATQVPFLGNMGLWGEAALIIPRAHTLTIDIPLPGGLDVTPNDGMMNKETQIVGYSIKPTPFIKATAGFDYTFGKHVYVQAQYLRGFINEFGAGHIGNYVVGGTDLVFFGRKLVFRAFGVVDFPSNNPSKHLTYDGKTVGGPSGVIAPALLVAPPWGYVNFELGGFALLGANKTAFGQAATGSSIAYFKVIGSF